MSWLTSYFIGKISFPVHILNAIQTSLYHFISKFTPKSHVNLKNRKHENTLPADRFFLYLGVFKLFVCVQKTWHGGFGLEL